MTFSISARDPDTGMFGVAVSTAIITITTPQLPEACGTPSRGSMNGYGYQSTATPRTIV